MHILALLALFALFFSSTNEKATSILSMPVLSNTNDSTNWINPVNVTPKPWTLSGFKIGKSVIWLKGIYAQHRLLSSSLRHF